MKRQLTIWFSYAPRAYEELKTDFLMKRCVWRYKQMNKKNGWK